MNKDAQKFLKEDEEKKRVIVNETRDMLAKVGGDALKKFDEMVATLGKMVEERGLRADAYTFHAMLEGYRLTSLFDSMAAKDPKFKNEEKKEMVAPLFNIGVMQAELNAIENEKEN